MSQLKQKGAEVARILADVTLSTFEMTTDMIVPTFDAAQVRCLALATSRAEAVEIRRRVAEHKMMELGLRADASFAAVDDLHGALLHLGYSDLEREGTMEICFARFCTARGKSEVAVETLRSLCSKLARVRGSMNPELYHELDNVAREFLAQIDTERRPKGK